ncbi:MAG: hypothetical protein OEY64_11655 [Nitrospinota bacterium]|nr:hypothetical protein [Nitrospinota bacterium]
MEIKAVTSAVVPNNGTSNLDASSRPQVPGDNLSASEQERVQSGSNGQTDKTVSHELNARIRDNFNVLKERARYSVDRASGKLVIESVAENREKVPSMADVRTDTSIRQLTEKTGQKRLGFLCNVNG